MFSFVYDFLASWKGEEEKKSFLGRLLKKSSEGLGTGNSFRISTEQCRGLFLLRPGCLLEVRAGVGSHTQLSAKWSHPVAQYHANKITCVVSVLPLENCKEIGLLSGFKRALSLPVPPVCFCFNYLLTFLSGWLGLLLKDVWVPSHSSLTLEIACAKVWPSHPTSWGTAWWFTEPPWLLQCPTSSGCHLMADDVAARSHATPPVVCCYPGSLWLWRVEAITKSCHILVSWNKRPSWMLVWKYLLELSEMQLMRRNNRFCRNCVGEISAWLGFERRLSQYVSKGEKNGLWLWVCRACKSEAVGVLHTPLRPPRPRTQELRRRSCFVHSCPRARRWNIKGIGTALALATLSKLEEQSTAEPCVLRKGFCFLCLWFCFFKRKQLLQLFWFFPPGL